MKVDVDDDSCQGHTLCVLAAERIFGSRDEDGHAVVLVSDVPSELEAAARQAAASCPERAIQLQS